MWNKKKNNRKRPRNAKKTPLSEKKKGLSRQELLEKRAQRRLKKKEPLAKIRSKSLGQRAQSFSLWDSLSQFFATDVGVDLGTSNVLVYVKGRGIVLNEPSCVARFVRTKEIIAVGTNAKQMVGRTPEDIEVVRPLREGVIADYDTTEYMLQYFVNKVVRRASLFKPRLLVCVPSGVTSVEKRAVLEASLQTGSRKTVLMEEPLAAALGTGLDKAKSPIAMVVDIGGGTTDIAVISSTGIVVSQSLRIGSDKFDEVIIYYLKRKRRLLIGLESAENVKMQIGSVDRKGLQKETTVKGRDITTGLPKTIIVTSKDIHKAIEDPVQTIVESVKTILEKTPPEMIAHIVDHGIILTGGGSLIDGFDRLLTRSTGIATYLSDHPLYSVVLGTGRALTDMNRFQDSFEGLE